MYSRQTYLIVNADDFGLSPDINRGIIDAHLHGIVTSASLLVRGAAAEEAVALSRDCKALSLGLHVDLEEWAFRNGVWECLYEVVCHKDKSAVVKEVVRQLDKFQDMTDRYPTHLDSHQHVHRDDPLRGVLLSIGRNLSIPVRHFSWQVRHCGAFYGQSAKGEPLPHQISVSSLIQIVSELPTGTTELGCHPGFHVELPTMYRAERKLEVQSLCNSSVRATINCLGIALCSFHDRAKAGWV